jgi:spoIIIJ-associated protein
LGGLFEILNIEAVSQLVSEDKKIEINVVAANSQSVIGKHGAMLDAIQTLAGAVANKGRDDYKRVVVDCENYRDGREVTLNRLAENLAAKSIRLGKKIKLEAMNPYERRIIHAALSEYEGVKTESEGKEPNRYVVIVPANLEDPEAPAIPARTTFASKVPATTGEENNLRFHIQSCAHW